MKRENANDLRVFQVKVLSGWDRRREQAYGMAKKLTSPILLVEGGAQDANIRYSTGFTAPDPIVAWVSGRSKKLVVSILEAGRARAARGVQEVLTPQQLGLTGTARNQLSEWALALLRREQCQRVQVAGSFPLGVADRLRQAGIQVDVMDGPLFPGRRRKTAAEIELITASQDVAVRAMRAALRTIRTASVDSDGTLRVEDRPLTSERVREVIDWELLQGNCVGDGTIVAGGEQGVEPHGRGSGPLKTGEPIVVDIFPRNRSTGYWGDITRTVVHGRAPAPVRRMMKAVKAAQQAAMKEVRAGVSVRRIHQMAQTTLSAHGFQTTVKNGWGEGFIHSTGHGIGLEVHEPPSVNLSSTRLIAGDVITIEPGLYYKGLGGVRFEDTVLVTKTGCRILAQIARTGDRTRLLTDPTPIPGGTFKPIEI
jgi:Xaa-Pro aminopeptidase